MVARVRQGEYLEVSAGLLAVVTEEPTLVDSPRDAFESSPRKTLAWVLEALLSLTKESRE